MARERPDFGYLPDIQLCRQGGIDFGFSSFAMVCGMKFGNEAVTPDVRITKPSGTNTCLHFQTSKIKLPSFAKVQAERPDWAPQPSIVLGAYYKKTGHGAYWAGLQLRTVADTGKFKVLATLPASSVNVTEGYAETVGTLTQRVDAWLLTSRNWGAEKWAGLWRLEEPSWVWGGTYRISKYRGHTEAQCPACCRFRFSGDVRPLPHQSEHCDASWDLVKVYIKFTKETVEVVEQQGPAVQIFGLVSSAGGIISVLTGALALIFVQKNTQSDVVLTYDERTFVLETLAPEAAQALSERAFPGRSA